MRVAELREGRAWLREGGLGADNIAVTIQVLGFKVSSPDIDR